VAQTKSTVLLQGETGTGKELLARTIHNLSSRKDRTMVMVNCSALPPGLIESELFGREKGAYTGALSKQLGRFEIADGSTIFLDEVSELSLELQAKLLRVLQDTKFERLGGTETIEVDVRVIAATNRDLAKAVSEGSFREDLYYRLHVFPITVPTLHERQEDIPLLVWAFVREFEKTMGKRITTIKQPRMEEMQRYPWPGNVRELRNVVEQAMIVNKGRTLNLRIPTTMMPRTSQDFKLETLERNHIMTILEKSGWRVKGKNGAAELLGLHPATLFSRMKKLGIKRNTNSDDISSRG
jgi:transcriptional regulator with GAF, ATPase, and Fis domain